MASVLIVDDSVMMRSMLAEIVGADPAFEVVGRAGDGCEAVETLRHRDCDVVLLDIEMPRMDGLEALKRMRLYSKAKVIVVSSSAQVGSPTALEARRQGAMAVIPKPSGTVSMDLKEKKGHEILRLCRKAAGLTGGVC
jgi:two-component system chemotaxis response regulator CheB